MTTAAWAALIGPVFATLGVILSAFIGRHSGRAAMRQAATEERRQVSQDWEAYTRSVREWSADMAKRLSVVESRLDACERCTREAEERAHKAERLLQIAVDFLRNSMAWFRSRYPGVEGLAVPEELKSHL